MSLRFSPHARERMAAMGVTEADVRLVVTDYEVSAATCRSAGDGDRRRYVRGDLVVFTTRDGNLVITVVPRRRDQYSRDDHRAGMPRRAP